MEKKIKIIIVDDHEIFRQGLIMVSKTLEGIEVVAEASNGQEFLDVLEQNKDNVDLVLMDIRMPIMDGLEATRIALSKYPELKVVAISMNAEGGCLQNMIDAGVRGFLIKNVKKTELEIAIKLIINDGVYYSKELMDEIIKSKPKKDKQDDINLTEREIEILVLIAQGLTNKEISDKLFISLRTVEGHKANLISKTNSKNIVNLLIYAINNKLIDIK